MTRRKPFWLAFAVVVIAIGLFAARIPPLPPREATPSPNGCDDFLQAATLLRGSLPRRTRDDSHEAIAAYVATNQPALERLRIGLTRPSLVPSYDLTNAQKHLDQMSGLKGLGILVARDAELARQSGDWERLVTSSTQGMELGLRIARGGVLMDQMVATAVESTGRVPLEKAAPDLPALPARKAALALATLETQREPFQRVLLSEEAFVRRKLPFTQRILWHLILKRMAQASFTRVEAKTTAAVLATRNLTLNLAARAYTLDRGQPPPSPGSLVPEYLPSVPNDPATDKPLDRFQTTTPPAAESPADDA